MGMLAMINTTGSTVRGIPTLQNKPWRDFRVKTARKRPAVTVQTVAINRMHDTVRSIHILEVNGNQVDPSLVLRE